MQGQKHSKRFILALVVSSTLFGCSSNQPGAVGPPEALPPSRIDASFAVLVSGPKVFTIQGDVVTEVGTIGIPPEGNAVSPSVAISRDKVVFVRGGWLAEVSLKGLSTRHCDRCISVGWDGEQIVATRPSLELGRRFEFLYFPPGAADPDVVVAKRDVDRFGDSTGSRQVATSADILAASLDTTWTAFQDTRVGNDRGGANVIAAYAKDGSLRSVQRVSGNIARSALSSDRRLMALSVGGSGGACLWNSTTEVLDLMAMRHRIEALGGPFEARGTLPSDEGGWFTATDLRWEGTSVHIEGTWHLESRMCETVNDRWEQTIDTATRAYSERRLASGEDPNYRASVGVGCDKAIVRDAQGELTVDMLGSLIELPPKSVLIYAPELPHECPAGGSAS